MYRNSYEEYVVDKENGVCICYIRNAKRDALEEFYTRTGISIYYPSENKFLMKDSYKGIAKCAPDDEFSEEVGVDLAFERAYGKYMKAKKKLILRMIKWCNHQLDETYNVITTSKKYKKF